MSKVIGLDLGTVTCGVAISDELGLLAHPVKTIRFSENDQDGLLKQLDEIVKEHSIDSFVLGLPRLMNGDLGPRAQASLLFKKTLEEFFELEVHLVDERFTTLMSERRLINLDMSRKKRKKVIDQAAAVEILQRYLDSQRRNQDGE